jgi:hypothetical protein
MDDAVSSERRNLIKAGAATLAAPSIAAATQEAAAASQAEAKVFNLWVISDQHVGTDKAASAGILHGLVGFKPPPVYFESWPRRCASRKAAARSVVRRSRGILR